MYARGLSRALGRAAENERVGNMRSVVVASVIVGSIVIAGCEEEKKPAPPAPSASAATTAASAMPSASAAPKLTMAEMQAASLKLVAEGINKHDAKVLASAYAPDTLVKVPGMPDVKGRETLEKMSKDDFAGVPDAKFGFGRVFAKGNVMVSEWTYIGTNSGPWMGKPATNRPVGVKGVSVVTLNDEGLIKEERRYFDMTTSQMQLDPKAKAGSFRPVPTVPTAIEMHVAKDDDATMKTMNGLYTAFESHKAADMMPFVTDDATYDDFSTPAQIKGKKPITDVVNGYNTAFPDFKQTHDVQMTADGFGITEGVLTGTHKGALGPIKASNKPVTVHFVDIWQIKDSKVVAGWTYVNSLELLVEVGAAPAPGAAPSASASAAASAGPAGPTGKPAPTATAR
jgi:steroid delta-isomerase-like uncharacterized protein